MPSIRKRNPNKRPAADPRLRLRGRWDRQGHSYDPETRLIGNITNLLTAILVPMEPAGCSPLQKPVSLSTYTETNNISYVFVCVCASLHAQTFFTGSQFSCDTWN